jgi:asparagine synthase (glutamine-hydrolysing)
LVELVWSFPPEWRRNKELLIEILGDRVPKEVMNRPKMGFGVPLASWLRGPLREWASDLMASSLVKDGEWFEASALEKIWLDHLSEKSDRSQEIWVVLSFLDWKSRH